MDQKETLKQLNKYEFHDLGIEGIEFYSKEGGMRLKIIALPYNAERKDYDSLILIFSDILSLTTDQLNIDEEAELELYSFDYDYNGAFKCELMFLLGFGKPSFEIKLICNKIEVTYVHQKL
jgi:hypothetical protein